MSRRLAPAFGLLAGLTGAMLAGPAAAQVNIDQGKTPAEMFASDCATCHKTARGLAVGKNTLTLNIFLREHYTASRAQAAALATYVLSAGGSEPAPPAARQKPETARASNEEPRTREPEPRTREPRGAEPKAGEAKTGEAGAEEPKPESGPLHAAAKPEESAAPITAPPPAAEAPNPAELPEVGPIQSAAAPEPSQPAATAPVPRDNIPD